MILQNFFTIFNPLELYEDNILFCNVLASIETIFGFFAIYDLTILALIFPVYIFYLFSFNNPEEEDDEEEITNKFNFYFIVIANFFTTLILVQNLTGAIPYSFALSANLFSNLILAAVAVLTIWFELFYRHKSDFFGHFLPNGAPTVIAPFIILIEIISTLSRIVSLAVRVFANMTAGHALVEIILKFSFAFLVLKFPLTLFFFLPIIIVSVIILLELLVVYLQSYVFGTLLSIYIDELS